MEITLYEETQEIPLRGPLTFLSAAAFFVIPLFTTMPLALILLMFALGIGMSYLIRSFMRMHTRVTQITLSFGPMIWTKRYPLAEIEVIGPCDIPFWAGVGIHGWRNKVYYNMRFGQGLEIKHGQMHFVFGTARAAEPQAALRDAQPRVIP